MTATPRQTLALAAVFLTVPVAFAGRAAQTPPASGDVFFLDALPLGQIQQDYGNPHAGKSVDGNPLTMGRKTYARGLGTHARCEFALDLKGAASKFTATVGVDDEKTGHGSVTFAVYVDGKKAVETPVLHGGDAPVPLSVDVTGAKRLRLLVTDAGDGLDSDHADWADAQITLVSPSAPRPILSVVPAAPPPPLAFGDSPKPAIHGPRVVGATPGRPFLFRIPVTGVGPLTFAVKNLPAGLMLDSQTGIITGNLKAAGTTTADVTASGPRGKASETLTIVGGEHKLSQTPPMGWNSWNVWAGSVDDAKVRAAADDLVKSGLAAHGFQYVNIDDTWEGKRDANGEIQTNEKFPDMKALADYVHSKGLKLGIYSSPGPKTCAGFEGSWQHEEQDAKTYAKWGIDYLKHDWCSYTDVATGAGLERQQKPYITMRAALDKTNRDIVYSLCQYGMGNVWEWGGEMPVAGNCWRTTGDINDSWGSLSGIGFSQNGHEKYAGPGHWNDPDMLVVGRLGWGANTHPTHLTANEQVTHISMWSLLAAPLLIGCDMSKLDKLTLSLLTNDEVLAIDQDALGKAAARKSQEGTSEVWARPLSDGTVAVGLFNRDLEPAKVTARWADLGLTGRQPVRDLWQKKNLSNATETFSATVPPHGAMLLKIGKPRP